MRVRNDARVTFVVSAVSLAVSGMTLGCRADGGKQPMSPEQQKRLADIRAEGTRASLTVFPIVLGSEAVGDAAEVVAFMLEQSGMANLELTDAAYRLPREATFDQAAELFGEFVRENPIETDYALYGQVLGRPKRGAEEIRGIIVDKTGAAVWIERQTKDDRAFKLAKPKHPMECCQFLAECVRKELGIPASARDESRQGKIARMIAKKSPGPDEVERSAMERRQAAMRKSGRAATLAVHPVRVAKGEFAKQEADHLAGLLGKKLCTARAVSDAAAVNVEPARNEQKMLWDLAEGFKAYVTQHPPEADYAMLADYIMHPSGDRAWAVHFVVCDREGEWVIVDYQNDHHGDFQSIDPKTFDDCGRLVAKRLKGYMQ